MKMKRRDRNLRAMPRHLTCPQAVAVHMRGGCKLPTGEYMRWTFCMYVCTSFWRRQLYIGCCLPQFTLVNSFVVGVYGSLPLPICPGTIKWRQCTIATPLSLSPIPTLLAMSIPRATLHLTPMPIPRVVKRPTTPGSINSRQCMVDRSTPLGATILDRSIWQDR